MKNQNEQNIKVLNSIEIIEKEAVPDIEVNEIGREYEATVNDSRAMIENQAKSDEMYKMNELIADMEAMNVDQVNEPTKAIPGGEGKTKIGVAVNETEVMIETTTTSDEMYETNEMKESVNIMEAIDAEQTNATKESMRDAEELKREYEMAMDKLEPMIETQASSDETVDTPNKIGCNQPIVTKEPVRNVETIGSNRDSVSAIETFEEYTDNRQNQAIIIPEASECEVNNEIKANGLHEIDAQNNIPPEIITDEHATLKMPHELCKSLSQEQLVQGDSCCLYSLNETLALCSSSDSTSSELQKDLAASMLPIDEKMYNFEFMKSLICDAPKLSDFLVMETDTFNGDPDANSAEDSEEYKKYIAKVEQLDLQLEKDLKNIMFDAAIEFSILNNLEEYEDPIEDTDNDTGILNRVTKYKDEFKKHLNPEMQIEYNTENVFWKNKGSSTATEPNMDAHMAMIKEIYTEKNLKEMNVLEEMGNAAEGNILLKEEVTSSLKEAIETDTKLIKLKDAELKEKGVAQLPDE